MSRLAGALIAFSVGFFFSWQADRGDGFDKAGWFAADTAYATIGNDRGGNQTGGPDSGPTVKRISLSSFLKRNRDGLIDLAEQNDREDTKIIIKGFSAGDSDYIIQTAAKDPKTVKSLLPVITGNLKKETKLSILENALNRLKTREAGYERSIRRLEDQYDREYKRLVKKRFGIRPVPKELPNTDQLDRERIRLRKTYDVRVFVESWIRRLRRGY